MEIQSTKIKYIEVVKDWITDLKDIDRRRKSNLAILSKKGEPIIIDYGSDTFKGGYLSSICPELIFKPLVSKTKDSTTSTFYNTINFTYDQLDILKNNYRTPYQRNIIQHFSLFEHCNDFLFSELGINQQTIKNPLIITQAAANPIYCRHNMIQLFFQCYGISEIFIGIDALFAYFHEINYNMHDYKKETRLIIHYGSTSTHIIPIIRGKVDFQSIKRLNFGSYNSFQMTAKLITLKNPELKNYLTYTFLKHIYNKFSRVALDYKHQLLYFRQGYIHKSDCYKNQIEEMNKKYPLPEFMVPIEIQFERPGLEISAEQIKRKQQIRKRMSDRLKQAIQKKKAEKMKIYQSDYQQLLKIKQKYKQDPQNMKQQIVNIFGQNKPIEIMNRKIKQLEIKLQIEPKQQEQKKFALLDIPDSQLPPEKQRLKKLQQYQKIAYQNRKKKQQEQQEQQKKMKQLREQNPQKYMEELKQRYRILSTKMKESQRIKTQLANRNSRLNQKRMQTLAQLAEQNQEQDNFGENDQDWLVYKGYQQSDHRSQVQAIEVQLRQIDPDWMQNSDKHHLNTGFNLYLGTQLIRGPQIYFQPSIIGVDQANLPDTIYLILNHYSKEIRQQLLQNILFTGGGSLLNGLKQRLQKQLISNFETNTKIFISQAKQAKLGAYYGMKGLMTKYPQYVKQNTIKKGEYFLGNLFPREHQFGKIYF